MVAVKHYGFDGNIVDSLIKDISSIDVKRGDNLVFLMVSSQVERFRKLGADLKIEFTDGQTLAVNGFFEKSDRPSESILTFQDTLYTASELVATYESMGSIVIGPEDVVEAAHDRNEHLFKRDGSTKGSISAQAFAGGAFLYHFSLDESFPEDPKIEVLLNGRPAPEWVVLEKSDLRKYVLRGVPTKEDIGENEIKILVHIDEESK